MRLVLERAERWRDPRYGLGELESAAKDACTEERLSELLGRKVILPQPAEGYTCRECPEVCVLEVDYKCMKGAAVVFCDQGIWEGPLEVNAEALKSYTLSEKHLRVCLRDDNGMEDLKASISEDIFAVGTVSRRGIDVQVYFARRLGDDFANTLRGVGSRNPGGQILVLSPTFSIASPEVQQGLTSNGIHHLCLLDALPPAGFALQLSPIFNAIKPEYIASRAKDPDFIFEDLRIEFREEPDKQHIVLFNGQQHDGFKQSDVNFARLLRIAVDRKLHPDVYHGGWMAKEDAGVVSEKNRELADLRKAIKKDPPSGYSADDMNIIVRTSSRQPGELRLAVDPGNICFHPSIREFKPLQEDKVKMERARAKKAKKAGQARGARKRSTQASKAAKGVENARALVEEALAKLPASMLSA